MVIVAIFILYSVKKSNVGVNVYQNCFCFLVYSGMTNSVSERSPEPEVRTYSCIINWQCNLGWSRNLNRP